MTSTYSGYGLQLDAAMDCYQEAFSLVYAAIEKLPEAMQDIEQALVIAASLNLPWLVDMFSAGLKS